MTAPDLTEPAHIEMPPILRRAANRMRLGPQRDAGLDSRIMAEPDADEPAHIRMPPILRRAAARRPPGPHRDAILRYAEELEERGDATLVPRATFRAALEAFGAEHEDDL